jgi:hypothetical protein
MELALLGQTNSQDTQTGKTLSLKSTREAEAQNGNVLKRMSKFSAIYGPKNLAVDNERRVGCLSCLTASILGYRRFQTYQFCCVYLSIYLSIYGSIVFCWTLVAFPVS